MPPTPQSNVERYLSVIAGHGGEIPSEPASRVEYYLNEIVKNGGIGGKLKPKVVASLPATGESGVLYLVPADGSGRNLYDEYIWIEEETRFELLGQTKIDIDLSDYVQKTRKVGGKPLSSDVGISVTGTGPIKVTDNGTASSIAYDISHEDSGVIAGSKGDTTNQTPIFGGTFKTLSATVDAKGHLTALAERSVTVPNTPATQSTAGLMSATDKKKLDNIIDSTLSNAGQAADAKTTGDNIAVLRELLSRMEIYCEASGNPATFQDAKAANVKALSVTITPTQAGSGDPYPPGGGKNLLNYDAWKDISIVGGTGVFENNGLTLTATTDDAYTRWTEGDGYPLAARIPVVEGETIILSWEFEPGDDTRRANSYIFPNGATKNFVTSPFGQNYNSYTVPSGVTFVSFRVGINGGSGTTASFHNLMVRRASDTDPTFAPYSNIRPIIGVSSVTVTRTGENGVNPQTVSVTLTDGANPLTVYGGTLNVTTGELTVTHVSHEVDGASMNDSGGSDSDLGNNIRMGIYRFPTANSLGKNCPIISNYLPMIPYSWNGDLSGICFWDTTGAYIKLPKSILDTPDVSGGKAYLTAHPLRVAYPVASPVTYQLTPAQITTLSGYNTVSSDAGTVDVTYKPDKSIILGGGI